VKEGQGNLTESAKLAVSSPSSLCARRIYLPYQPVCPNASSSFV
jgi:hypothetical protein